MPIHRHDLVVEAGKSALVSSDELWNQKFLLGLEEPEYGFDVSVITLLLE
jgi:hypothetical protein